YVLECDISTFIVWIKYCIDNLCSYSEEGIYELFDYLVIEQIGEYIFKDQNMECSNIIDEAIAQSYPDKKDLILNHLHYTWFMYLISQKTPNIELVKDNFDAIQNPNHIPNNFRHYNDKEKIAEALTEQKELLCTSEDSIAKFDELIRRYKPDPTTP
ncbi:hypothetical protein NEAUS06_2573, partial [Nematocida ausubeli]